MKKRITMLILPAILAASAVGLFAQDVKALRTIFAVSKEARAKLKAGQTVAIFLTGNDTLFTRIMEDALDIHLVNAGFEVVNREKLEKTVGEQVEKKRKEKAEGVAINALDVGKAVNAALIVTGTVVVESDEQKALILKIGSFQLLDALAEKTLINVLFEPEKGQSFSGTAQEFVEIVKQSM